MGNRRDTISSAGTTPGNGTVGADVGRLQSLLDRVASRPRIGHAVMGVASDEGSWEWVGAAGVAALDGRPMRGDTPFFVASVTKQYITAVVLQMHERQEIHLDDPITDHLPPGRIDRLHVIDGIDNTPHITIRHLLSHTSGLPDYLEDRPRRAQSMYEDIADGRDRSWTFDDVVRITRDDLRPYFPPQDLTARTQRARYSDTNFQVLLAIVEAVAGESFPAVFERRLFRPLGLQHTWFPGHSEPLDAFVGAPAEVWSKGAPLQIPKALTSFNDLVSTTGDTLAFLARLRSGAVFEDSATLDLMQERWNRVYYPIRYGLGTMRYRIPVLYAPGRRPVTLIGHTGSTGSWLFHCPELGLLLSGTVDEIDARALPFRFLVRVLRAAVS